MLEYQKRHLKIAGKFLQKYDLLKAYVEMQNRDYEMLEIPEMKYSLNEENSEKDIATEKIFTDEYIETLKPTQLATLNAFWQNRFIKEAIDLAEVLFVFDTLDLWDNCDFDKVDLTDEQIKNSLLKEYVCDSIFEEIKDNMGECIKKGTFSYGLINFSSIDEKTKQYYQEFFNKILPEANNDLLKDLSYGQNKRNAENVIYKNKYNMLQELLLDIEHNSNITNWGYIQEKKFQKNTIERKRKNILIGIDYPGFNMPLRIHTDRNELLEFIKTRKNNTIIPIYEGNQDFTYKGKLLTTKLFMPLAEKRESEIIGMNKKINATDSRYGYIKHLGNLITKKAKAIQKIYPSRYVDLETGIEGTMTRDKNFLPDKTIDENTKLR